MLDLVADLGIEVDRQGNGRVRIVAEDVLGTSSTPCSARGSAPRSPSRGRCSRAGARRSSRPPGGDVIGRRRLDTLFAFARLGAEIEADRKLHMTANGLVGARIFLDEASVTSTEARSWRPCSPRETTITNAACEPHVQDLCNFLVALGARIEGIGSNVLHVRGVDRLGGGEWRICPDHIEVASFVGLGAVTEGEIVVEDVVHEHLAGVWHGFARLGIECHTEGSSVRVPGGGARRDPGRPRRPDPQDRRRPVAGLPGRP